MHSPVERIGCLRRGAVDVKRHMWFDTMEWGALLEKHMEVNICNDEFIIDMFTKLCCC
jgi:hypothetical protein